MHFVMVSTSLGQGSLFLAAEGMLTTAEEHSRPQQPMKEQVL
jgi:hypothetical protein